MAAAVAILAACVGAGIAVALLRGEGEPKSPTFADVVAACPSAPLMRIVASHSLEAREAVLDVPEPTPCSINTAIGLLAEIGNHIHEFPCDYVVLSHNGNGSLKLSPSVLRQIHFAYDTGEKEAAIRLFTEGCQDMDGSFVQESGEPEVLVLARASQLRHKWAEPLSTEEEAKFSATVTGLREAVYRREKLKKRFD